MTEKQSTTRELHLLTTDVLLADLVSGRSIALTDGKTLEIESDDARAILDWYRRNPNKWVANQNTPDTDAVINLIGSKPPIVALHAGGPASKSKLLLHLVQVKAHRFAGLHVYGLTNEPPEDFDFCPRKNVTLLEGANGSGKTSIANAIVWCLTGHLIRSQRQPEAGPTEFYCEVKRSDTETSTHAMSAITPMPLADSDLPADGSPIPADTWVELTFSDGDGNLLPPLRRSQVRTPRGKITETPPDLEAIGLDPVAWRIATTMPALLPFLSVGSVSQLGEAVARLTGLSDLVDLAKHSERLSERIEKRSVPDLEALSAKVQTRYREPADDLARELLEYEAMALDEPVPSIHQADCKTRLETISKHFTDLKAAGLASATKVLGSDFDPENKQSRDDLEKSIHPAIEQLNHVKTLPAIAKLSALKMEDDDRETIRGLVAEVQAQAAMLSQLALDPNRARRAQLYARVSAWMHQHSLENETECPICTRSLDGIQDPVTGNLIRKDLEEAAKDRETTARTIREWSSYWVGRLLQELPDGIKREVEADLPAAPIDLLRTGFIDELFATDVFAEALHALKADTAQLFDKRAAVMPAFKEPETPIFPDGLSDARPLQQMLGRIVRASAFAEWRASSAADIRMIWTIVLKGDPQDVDVERAVGRRLAKLLSIVEGVAPLSKAMGHVERMERARAEYMNGLDRIEACRKAVKALAFIKPLGALAHSQVDGLRSRLHNRSEFWRKEMFRNATDFAPDLTGTAMDARGILDLRVGRQGVEAPAQHISNASSLRAALLGFFLAFREHVLRTRGGLRTLVLDDPQELLDNDNRERLARGLSKLAATQAQLLVTTHDRKFARSLVAENRPRDSVEHLSVHPVNRVRPKLGISLAIEEVDRKRDEFVNSPDDAVKAQDYASALRVFLEVRLGDLFDETTHPAFTTATHALTLSPLVDRLRGLIASNQGELFRNPILKRFVDHPGLASDAEAKRILNASHHQKPSISYGDVKAVAAHFAQLRTAIEDVHQQFRLYRWREPLTDAAAASNIVPLKTMSVPDFVVPLFPDIAAFVGNAPEGGSQDVPDEQVIGNWFQNKALYYVRGETLGFAIPSGSVAIVDVEPYPGSDRNLVIARPKGQVLARRLVKSTGSIGVSLAAQMPDPRVPRPTLTFDESQIRLHRIVGAIFSDMPPPPGGNEAIQIEEVPELEEVAVAYRVKEESAIPLALPGQIILGGAELSAQDLDAWEGRLVAVALDDGANVFKRVGARLPGKLNHLRQLETIGGLGSSLVVATVSSEAAHDVPTMVTARKVIGVLYS
ncbi:MULTISPECIES: AAA family ATPase [Rhizobium]|uniref:AAA family ATPase n=1 Tax=Rhizobium TaxID=379 RepID=UPI0023A9A4AE|nr:MULTISPECIES: AAA family ATPase [unclassified Rhizobium]WEA23944.1 AAA family ATPase [Rhizobium sp. MJ22]WEA58467.1 AAA family ATPase [Rhizobium sp. BJ04]